MSRKHAVVYISEERGRRIAEAVRLAAGLAVNQQVAVTVMLGHSASRLGEDDCDETWALDARAQHVPLLLEHGAEFCMRESPTAATSSKPSTILFPIRVMKDQDWVNRFLAADVLIRF